MFKNFHPLVFIHHNRVIDLSTFRSIMRIKLPLATKVGISSLEPSFNNRHVTLLLN